MQQTYACVYNYMENIAAHVLDTQLATRCVYMQQGYAFGQVALLYIV